MFLPNFLAPYRAEAEQYLKQGLVKDVEFSGRTYQVLVIDRDTGKEVWSFLQLDNRGGIKDCFCSCRDEEQPACVHLCAAFLQLYNQHPLPLHHRFEASLWNQLCRLYADKLGDDPAILKLLGKERFGCKSAGGKVIFEVGAGDAAGAAYLNELLKQRKWETEETSLKFSNLSSEEIALWREGRPSPQLKYELSFWSDLAKWLMRRQESGEKYQIRFGFSAKGLPNEIHIAFPQVELKFYLSEANLPCIIPALASVESPLKVHNDPAEDIEKITYEKNEGCLLIAIKPAAALRRGNLPSMKKARSGYNIGPWIYVQGDGFYAAGGHELSASPKICGQAVAKVLNTHYSAVQHLLRGALLHDLPVHPGYSIAFDSKWNLHITCFVFAPGDLSLPASRRFGNWVYLDGDGFYRLEGAKFDDVEAVIPSNTVADFVTKNRSWLSTQEGFHTHLTSIEAQLAYHMSPDGRLSFFRKIAVKDEGTEMKDFGSWVYVAGEGFYSKANSIISLSLPSGITVSVDQIPLFIKANRDELQMVPGFFGKTCPVAKAGLDIRLDKLENVVVVPQYQLSPMHAGRDVRFFDDIVYTEGEGFYELPADLRLPERYRHPVVIEKDKLNLFLLHELPSIQEHAFHLDPELKKPEWIKLSAASIAQDPGKPYEYLIKLYYHSDSGRSPAVGLWDAVKHKKKFFFSGLGMLDLEEKRYNWLRWVRKEKVDKRSRTFKLSALELLRLHALEELEVPRGRGEEAVRSRELLEELTKFHIPNDPDLTGLKSILRPYQMMGLRWLWFLYKHSLSGLLCDDMGLGKTHQTMALMAAIFNEHRLTGKAPPRFLIICPTSVIYHWFEKLEAFLPEARVCSFHGSGRSLHDLENRYDIILTSYGVWRIDNEAFNKLPCELAVFDEVHLAKNQSSRIYGALQKVQANMRLGLTGTPIENRLRELKSLFDIVLPGYMPGEADYRELFIKPIEKEGSETAKQSLTRLIKPFVLRRKKGDVLLDLPEKIEEISHCDLAPEQQQLYNEVLHSGRESIVRDLEDKAAPIPYVHIFSLLSSLKQICNHPAVYYKTPEKYTEYASGKWELFLELLTEARESGQKVVVYSQYLAMLDIIEAYLEDLDVGFASIRGATINRGEQLQRFSKDPACEVFVASLQAAGLGVDLTAASVVIHYDRWWNAARENQATDRVHRIGQTRGVQVFKLVTKNTFEERIDQLISRKGKLMEEVVGIDDHRFVKSFTRDEILQLLAKV